ncbi:SbcC/MukB-like Walker B domain-containing protein [Sphingomonas colocasiae]|uniref:AAA family ATPase n=1 Tax=Sphingomonas colocasiae TaxID=1848973 RepID=A0ABS7PRP9_9SPHN|nr:SbcC/MukB-like Walker B domain-containing protein [Sphingomonas colocasiae]MBY8823350.1 AAA family ATPase [Sphingomonas colocasiae]
MIELSRIVLLNWHMISRADLNLGGDLAILGQNRSGKSTIIDLIQAVLAGGSARLYRFNRSAGESGSRSDRTLAGYCLGQLSDDSFLRNQAITHVALVFEDRSGNRLPVSLGLSVEATRGRPAEVVGMYVAEGVVVDTGMLIDEQGDSIRPSEWSVVRRRLERACVAGSGQLHTPGDARSFIREYMRALFTRRKTSDPDRFARTFIAALSFMDMTSVEQFVRRYLLERRDVDIAELRESIQRYREIQKTITDLEKRLEALGALKVQVERYAELLADEDACRSIERTALVIEAVGGLLSNIGEKRSNAAELANVVGELERLEVEIATENETLEAIRRQLNATGAAAQRESVQRDIKDIDRARGVVMDRLRNRYLAAARATQLLKMRDRLSVVNPGELLKALEAIQKASDGLEPPDWPRDPAAMDRLLDELAAAAQTRVPKALDLRNKAITWASRIRDEIAEDLERLAAARSGRVPLSAATTRLIETLRAEGMQPRTLCEVADIQDEDWRDAVEALMARDREAIIVAPEHASRATAILRHGRGSYPRCRVVNTAKLQSRATAPEARSLASVVTSSDPLAMAFVVFRIGNVLMAGDQEALLSGGRAVMMDGSYNDSIVTEMRKADQYKIGLAAAPLMEASLTASIEEKRRDLATHEANEKFFEDILARLKDCSASVDAKDRLDAIVLELDGISERRAEALGRLEAISAMVDPSLLNAEAKSKLLIGDFTQDREDLIERRGAIRKEADEIRKRLGAGDGMPGSYLCLAHRRRQFKVIVPTQPLLKKLRPRLEELSSRPWARVASDMAKRASEVIEAHRALERDIRLALGRYAMNFPDTLEGAADAKITGAIRQWVTEGVEALEGNELIRYRSQADEAADRVSRLFRTNFIHELNSRFGTLEAELETLGRALRSRPLHGEIYQLQSLLKPEFEDLYRLARDSETDESVLDALFGRGEPKDERHARALQKVEQLLADEEFDFAIYQDYRNYFAFDLRMRDVASGRTKSFDRHRGVASGAERQVPFYVVIGAALSSIYHGSRQFGGVDEMGIGLAVFDEAFSKMDGPNQRTLLDFYREIGLQVVIAAPSEKRAAVFENLDCVIDVYRSGDVAFAETVQIRERARQEMRAANPQHASDEQLAERYGLTERAAE